MRSRPSGPCWRAPLAARAAGVRGAAPFSGQRLSPRRCSCSAAFGTVLARAFSGQGGWHEGRAAFFWAALVSSPVLLLSGLLPLAFPGAPGVAIGIGTQIGPVFFAWALAQCYAEAFGFRRASNVLGIIALLSLEIGRVHV